MDFYTVLDQVITLLHQRGRLTYGALKRQFQIDDDYLADLKAELIEGQRVAVDEGGKVLVWKGAAVEQEPGTQRSREPEQRPAPTDANAGTDRPKGPRLDAAERRQLTVMFCDLVGSTALSEQLDPEELREVVQRYQETCTGVIRQYDGHIAQHLGDGLLVYFGYPEAHEDDAARAVRTALGIVEAMQQLSFPTIQLPRPLQVRIGIHTGLVVIGEIGSSEKREMLALGETPNMAARLQGIAEPDTVVISAATQRLVQDLFACQHLGSQDLKGLMNSVAVYHVLGESGVQSRFEAAVHKGLTPLVGRELEVGVLRERWLQAKAGAGQIVLLSGEPGIGKSRLVQELKEQLSAEGAACIEFRCSPYHQNSALYPLIDHLQRLLQFAREDAPAVKLEKLQHTLALHRFPQADSLPLLAALLSLPHPEGFLPLTVSPQKQKEKTQAALVAWLVEEAERQPVYTTWEDMHWADPSTLEVLRLVVDQTPTAKLYVVLTFRPEFQPPWGNRSHLRQLTLSRLERSQVEAMIEQVTDDTALAPEIVQQIVVKTDGVPLFVEELTKTVIETLREQRMGNREQDGHRVEGQGGSPSFQLGVPPTLQDALMARLDRLGPAKDLAQLGATLGREFSYELIQAVSSLDEERLQHELKQLVTAELVYQHGLAPQATYVFKHALIQDTAYQSLLKSKRRQLHQQIARVLEEQFAETKETQPELLAHHYTEAGLSAQAIPYWQRAGERAIYRSAHVEAISHLTKGLELLKTLPDSPEHTQQEITLQLILGVPLTATKGYGAPEMGQVYARALELCRQVGNTPHLFPVLHGLWEFYLLRAELQTARELGEQMFSLAHQGQNPALLLEARQALGATLFQLGEFVPAREHLEQGIALYDPQQHRSHAFLYYGLDSGVTCRSRVASVLWLLGYPEQASKRSREALTLAQELAHPNSLGYALHFAAMLYQFRREEPIVQEQAEAEIALSTEHGFPHFLAYGPILRGWALAGQGQGKEGITQMRHGLAAYQTTGAELERPHWLALLAEAYGKAGQAEEGLTVIAEGLATAYKTGESYYEAELYRLKGEFTLHQSNVQRLVSSVKKEVEECFHRAIEISRKQQAKSLELRATTSLARLWRHQGKRAEAHTRLSEVYDWFTEGFDTKDLREAKALLAELGGKAYDV